MPPAPLPRTAVAVVGEALVDLVVQGGQDGDDLVLHPVPGGGPYTTAVALARLGVEVRLLARLGEDRLGRLLRDHAEESGVDLSAAVVAQEPTTLALADVDPEGRAEYTFHLEATSAFSWAASELPESLPVGCVHTGTLATTVEPSADLLAGWLLDLLELPDPPALSLDPNVREVVVRDPASLRRRLSVLARVADVVKASDEDLEFWLPGRDPREAAEHLVRAGARLVAVTRGPQGAFAVWRDDEPDASPRDEARPEASRQEAAGADGGAGRPRRVSVDAQQVDVVDTVGAGDSFAAGLLASLAADGVLSRGLPGLDEAVVRAALDAGVHTSALTVQRRGADPPRRSQVPPLADRRDRGRAPTDP